MKPTVVKLVNPIQHYAWGSRAAIAQLQGRPSPSPRPEAELWIGDHPVAPSSVLDGGPALALPDWIARDPTGVLGPGREHLPFLAKILAADRSLSVQVHPDAGQARRGFEREERLGIAAERRCYRDANAKHELLVALSPFEALCGFRSDPAVEEALGALSSPTLHAWVEEVRRTSASAAAPLAVGLFHRLQRLAQGERASLAEDVARFAGSGDSVEARWTSRLQSEHRGDPLCLVPLLMNCVVLAPGEGLVVRPGTVHAYLSGTGVEVMTRSDNVVRGGLTRKHVDPDELREVTASRAEPAEVVRGVAREAGTWEYATGTRAFALSVLRPAGTLDRAGGSVRVLVCVEGAVEVRAGADAVGVALAPGEAALVAAGVERYRLLGNAPEGRVFEVSGTSR